jgi:formamidopyrimidine-DNA glycosylase
LLKELNLIELPEAAVLAEQINKTVVVKRIRNVIAAHTPHKLAWYFGDPQEYKSLLTGKVISEAAGYGGQVEITADKAKLLFSDGVNLRYCSRGDKRPDKHQLLLEFDDASYMVGWVQMYGGLSAFPEGENDNKYYLVAKEKPSPLSGNFDEDYFKSLFDAKMHPKKKVGTVSAADKQVLFDSIKNTLLEMTARGGRDTEYDLFGKPGEYKTKLSKNTVGQPCPTCGTLIEKEAYLGGSIYYCTGCQRI